MKKRKFGTLLTISALALSVSLVFSGCTGSSGSSGANKGLAQNEVGLVTDAIGSSDEKNSESPQSVSIAGNGLDKKNGSADALKELKIIKSANVTIEAGNAFTVFTEISGMAEDAGGFVQDSSVYEENGKLTLRIPTSKADALLKEIRENYKIKNFSESSKDVSDEYTDNQSRLESARTALKRYQELLSKANSIDEILRVQDRIDDITADIESYEALKASYDSKVAYETIVITINNPVVVEDNRWSGLSESLSDGMFVGFAVFLHVLIILLYCLPFIIVILVIIALVSRHNRKKKKNMPPPPVMPYPPAAPYPPVPQPGMTQQSAPQMDPAPVQNEGSTTNDGADSSKTS